MWHFIFVLRASTGAVDASVEEQGEVYSCAWRKTRSTSVGKGGSGRYAVSESVTGH